MSNARNIASGAKFVDTAGDTMTGDLTVNKNGNVAVTIETDDTNQATLLFKEGGVSKYNVAHVGSSDTFQVWNYTTNTRALGIDNASRVTMPSQPYFYAYGAGANAGQYFSGRNIGDTVVDNVGSHYSVSSNDNKFTAPVAGSYFFAGGALKYTTNTVSLQLRVNGNSKATDYAESGSGHQCCSVALVIHLNVNDYVQLYAANGNWYDNGPATSNYNWFSGCLIG